LFLDTPQARQQRNTLKRAGSNKNR